MNCHALSYDVQITHGTHYSNDHSRTSRMLKGRWGVSPSPAGAFTTGMWKPVIFQCISFTFPLSSGSDGRAKWMAGRRVANTSSEMQALQCKDLITDMSDISLISISANLKPLWGLRVVRTYSGWGKLASYMQERLPARKVILKVV